MHADNTIAGKLYGIGRFRLSAQLAGFFHTFEFWKTSTNFWVRAFEQLRQLDAQP